MDGNFDGLEKQFESVFRDWHIVQEIGRGTYGAVYEIRRESAGVEDRAALKGRLYRELLRGAGVDEKRIGAILRVTDLDGMTVRDGRLEEEERLTADILREWADFIGVTKTRGALVETPPTAGRPARTRAEIEAIRDGGERRRAIAENAALFGLEVAD